MGLIKLYRSGFNKGINPYQETQDETGMDFDILIMDDGDTFEISDKDKEIALVRTYLTEAIFQGAEILSFSYTMKNRINALPKEKEKRKIALKKIKTIAKEFYKNYSSTIDEELFSAMLEMYYYDVPKTQHAKIFKTIENQLFGFKKLDFDWYAKNVFSRSIFSSKEKFFTFLENPSSSKIERDPAYKTLMSIYNQYLEQISPKRTIVREDLAKGNRLFIDGLRKMNAVVEHNATPQILGMVKKVSHLVTVVE